MKDWFETWKRTYVNRNYILNNKAKLIKYATGLLIFIIALGVFIGNQGAGTPVLLEETSDTVTTAAITGETEAESSAADTDLPALIVVDVCGAVKSPGVIIIPAGSRVYEAIAICGGVASDSDVERINQATVLEDGDQLYIPRKNEKSQTDLGSASGSLGNPSAIGVIRSTGSTGGANKPGLININTANSTKLQELNGVGPSTAAKIIEYREQSGGFEKIEDLMEVKGIGTKTFEKLKPYITI